MTAAERSLRSELTRLTSGRGLIDGSLVKRRHRCGKPTCRCARGAEFGHRGVYLFRGEGGGKRQLYVPKEWEPRVRQWLDNYHDLRRLTRELCELHWQQVLQREGKRGRGRGRAKGKGRGDRGHGGEAQ